MLPSVVQWSESAISIHISPYPLPLEPPSHPPYPTLLGRHKHWVDLPVLWSSFPLAIHFKSGSVYMSILLSHFVPASPSPPCPQVHSLCPHRYSCPALGSSVRFFRFHTCMLAYSICFSPSELLHSVWDSRSIHLITNNSISFPFMANTSLYICTTSSLSIHLSMVI